MVSPPVVAITRGGQIQLTATVTGTGSYNTSVTWSAQKGSITSAGLYTAPALSGSDVVTATSAQDSTKTASVSVTVNAVSGQVAPAAPTLSGPTEVQLNAGPYTATVALGTGLSAQWSITGGTLVGATNGSTVQFQAGSAPIVTLSCTVSNSVGSATSSRWAVALPFAPRNYSTDFKAYLNTHKAAIRREVASGDSSIYYSTSYYLHGMAAAAEATGDTGVMDTLLGYINQIMAQAKPVVLNGVTYQELGPWDPNGRPWQLYTFQFSVALARTAAIITSNPTFNAKYSTQAAQIVAFVDQSIFKYWFDKQVGVYADPGSKWLGGDIPWLSTSLGGWGSYAIWSDKCSHLGAMSAWMYQATKSPLYLEYATRIATGFKTHVKVQSNGSWVWDQGIITSTVDGGAYSDNQDGSPDTSHANREPMMAVAMYEAGVVFQLADLQAMGSTLTSLIWNQSESNPMFNNYTDGGNLAYGSVPAWADGNIYLGWNMLGKYSAQAQRVLAIAYNAMLTQTSLNASLATNATSYGKIEYSGTLTRNIAR
jgi:hypothetical protein